jgi:dTMP kinase
VAGKFITLEGGEGVGKSTLARGLVDALERAGHEVILTREPGGTPNAETLRDMLLHGAADRWSPIAEALLLYAARADHIERVIAPALARGAWVICDRFADSTTAYQGVAGGLQTDRLERLRTAALGGFGPHVTLILDLDPRTGFERVAERGEESNRFEDRDQDFHVRLRAAYLDIACKEPKRCAVIDTGLPPDAVLRASLMTLQERLGSLKA